MSTASTCATAGSRASPTSSDDVAARPAAARCRACALGARRPVAGDDEPALRDSSSVLPPGAAQRSATALPAANAAYRVTSVDAGILHEEQPLPVRAELGQRRRAGDANAVAHERSVLDVYAGALEHRLELLAHDADTAAR